MDILAFLKAVRRTLYGPFSEACYCMMPVVSLGSIIGAEKIVREVLHGVGADGVGVKFPILAVNCSLLPLSSERIREKRRKTYKRKRKTKKSEE